MSNTIQQTGNSGPSPSRMASADSGSRSLTAPLFVLFVVELFIAGVVVWSYLINRYSFPESASSVSQPFWGWVALVAASWGTCYLLMSQKAAQRLNFEYSRRLLGVVVASGSVLLGVLMLNVSEVLVSDPVFMDVRAQFAVVSRDAEPVPDTAAVGDAANGKKWFGMSCITCHGPTGDGVLNAAPSLRDSEFLRTADNATIASLIRNGRAANDPANKTGKVMPPKGGNPFLEESKIADLVALLKDMDIQFGEGATDSGPAVTTDLAGIQTTLSDDPVPIIRKWKMADLEGLDIRMDEESVATGMQAFVKANCHQCHMAAVDGKQLGPTLDQVVGKYPQTKLLQHMVEPSAEINEKYQSHNFLLVDGRMVSGVIVSETDERIEVMTDLLKPDERQIVLVDDIEDQAKSMVSAMPEGLLDVLTRTEIEGLVAYVDAAGHQISMDTPVVLNRWVVPATTRESMPTILATTHSRPQRSFGELLRQRRSSRYTSTFSHLFVTASSVLAFHFLWVVGSGAAIVMHRELQLSSRTQDHLAKHTMLFWSWGVVWLVIWFLVFFLIG